MRCPLHMHISRPVVDGYSSRPFIPVEPMELIAKGDFAHVPMMVGGNKDEGLLTLTGFMMNDTLRGYLVDNWDEYIPTTLLSRATDEQDPATKRFATAVKNKFLGGRDPDIEKDFDVLNELFGDVLAGCVGTKTARMLAAKSSKPVYEYRYNHVGSLSLFDFIFFSTPKFFLRVYIGSRSFVAQMLKRLIACYSQPCSSSVVSLAWTFSATPTT